MIMYGNQIIILHTKIFILFTEIILLFVFREFGFVLRFLFGILCLILVHVLIRNFKVRKVFQVYKKGILSTR